MTSKQKPVTGADLEALKYRLGLNEQETYQLLQIPHNRWNVITKNPEVPIDDVCIAIMVRYFDAHPDDPLVPKKINPADLYEKLDKRTKSGFTLKKFAILHGREGSSGYRLKQLSGKPSPQLGRLMSIINRLFDQKGEAGLKIITKIVDAEALARNKPDIWKTGRWGSDEVQSRPGRPVKATKEADEQDVEGA